MPKAERDAAITLLDETGARAIEHPGGDLFVHLVRTEAILTTWGAAEHVCLAGLCHAFYGTAGFDRSLLPLTERATLRDAIGARAEAVVYRYASCDRRATYAALGPECAPFTDRFTATTENLAPDAMHEFAVITIANEFDLFGEGAFDAATAASVADLFERLARYAPAAARIALAEMSAR